MGGARKFTRKLSSFITRPQAKRSTWKEQLNLAGEAARPLRTQPSAAGAGALLGGIFGGGKGAGIGSIIGGAGGLGTTAFHGRQKISLNSGQEMLIRITGG
jgi:hypothetical protein